MPTRVQLAVSAAGAVVVAACVAAVSSTAVALTVFVVLCAVFAVFAFRVATKDVPEFIHFESTNAMVVVCEPSGPMLRFEVLVEDVRLDAFTSDGFFPGDMAAATHVRLAFVVALDADADLRDVAEAWRSQPVAVSADITPPPSVSRRGLFTSRSAHQAHIVVDGGVLGRIETVQHIM
jgi:hypothetical protein